MRKPVRVSEEEQLAEMIALDAMLIRHLERGGAVEDQLVRQWIDRLVRVGMQSPWLQPFVHEIPLSAPLLIRAYGEVLAMLMPNPLVQTENGPRLVPSLLFLDPDVLPNLISREGERLKLAARSEDHEEVLEILRQEVQRLYRVLTAKTPPVPLATNDDGGLGGQAGCASISLRLVSLTVGAVAVFKGLF